MLEHRTLLAFLIATLCQLDLASADGPPFSIQDVPKDGASIVLDGKIGAGEWNGTKLNMSYTHGQTRESGGNEGPVIPCEESGVCNGEPLSVSIQYAWDDTSFYYLVEETTIDDDPTTGITAGDWCEQCSNGDATETAAAPWSTDSVGFYTTGIKWTPGSLDGEAYDTTEMGPLIQPWVGLTTAEDLVIDGEPQYRHLTRVVTPGYGESAAQLIGPDHEEFDSYITDLEDRWDFTQPQSAFGVTEDGRRVAEMYMRWDQLLYDLEDADEDVQERLEVLEEGNPGVTELINLASVAEGLEFRMDPLLVDGTDDFSFGGQTHPAGNQAPQVVNGTDEFWEISVVRLTGPSAGTTGDFDRDGDLDSDDVNALIAQINGAMDASFDVSGDGAVNGDDLNSWVKELKKTWVGDANLDGEFNSSDFVAVFQAGKFESNEAALWGEGDWNGDGVFSSGDFVAAFQDGGFELGPVPTQTVPEPGTQYLLILGGLVLFVRRRIFS